MVNDNFGGVVQQLEARGGVNLEATRRRLVLGARDSATGWRAKTFKETTVKGVLFEQNVSSVAVGAGTYGALDATYWTQDVFEKGDELLIPFDSYYEVKGVRNVSVGNSFSHRVVHLRKRSLHE